MLRAWQLDAGDDVVEPAPGVVFPQAGDALTGVTSGQQSVGAAVKSLTPLASGGRRGVKGFLAASIPVGTPLRKQLLGKS